VSAEEERVKRREPLRELMLLRTLKRRGEERNAEAQRSQRSAEVEMD